MQMGLGRIKGFKPKFNLYTVPGQVIYIASCKLILKGTDDVICMADSQADKLRAKIEKIWGLEENLRELGYNPFDIPLVLQFNKRDLPDPISVEILCSYLARDGCPHF